MTTYPNGALKLKKRIPVQLTEESEKLLLDTAKAVKKELDKGSSVGLLLEEAPAASVATKDAPTASLDSLKLDSNVLAAMSSFQAVVSGMQDMGKTAAHEVGGQTVASSGPKSTVTQV